MLPGWDGTTLRFSIRNSSGKNIVLMHDNARLHGANVVEYAVNKMEFDTMDWPISVSIVALGIILGGMGCEFTKIVRNPYRGTQKHY